MSTVLLRLPCLIFALLVASGCSTADDDIADDDDVSDDDSNDDDAGDDDSGDDDSGDDDTSGDDTNDDDSSDDDSGDDDTAPEVHILEIQIDNLTLDPVGYKHFDAPANPTPLSDAPAVVDATISNTLANGCFPFGTYLDFHYCDNSMGDINGMALVDGRTGQLVYAGEIIFDGGPGSPIYPLQLDSAKDLMAVSNPPAASPMTLEYLLWNMEPEQQADQALLSVRSMDYVRTWIGFGTYDVLIYLHAYRVGTYDPYSADWIIFLVLH